MKLKFYFFSLLFFSFFYPSICTCQPYPNPRYLNPEYFTKEKIKADTDVVYGESVDWKGVSKKQKFNIYYPSGNYDVLKRRPFIMLMHGGGFQEDDITQKKQWNNLCMMFAQRGFVTSSIDYRVGWDYHDKEINPKSKVRPSYTRAAYRAYQDGHAAIRFFVHHAHEYGIDTNAIFIGGRSAGGEMGLVMAFLSQRNIDSLCNSLIPENCHQLYGSIDSSTNTLTDKFKIKGVINMWGPIADTSFISKEEALATSLIMFHGTKDKSVPYKRLGPPDYPYTRDGSFNIAQRYKHMGGCYELNTKVEGTHSQDFSNEFLADHVGAFINSVLNFECEPKELETTVSVDTNVETFITSGLFIPLSLLMVALILIVILIRLVIVKRRKRKKMML